MNLRLHRIVAVVVVVAATMIPFLTKASSAAVAEATSSSVVASSRRTSAAASTAEAFVVRSRAAQPPRPSWPPPSSSSMLFLRPPSRLRRASRSCSSSIARLPPPRPRSAFEAAAAAAASSEGEVRLFSSATTSTTAANSTSEASDAGDEGGGNEEAVFSDDGVVANVVETTNDTNESNERRRRQRRRRGFSNDPPPDPSTFPPWSYDKSSSTFDHFEFEVVHQSERSLARVGRIHTPHGVVDTPSFVAVATNAALKGLDMRDADLAGQQLVFCNTYHLLLHPGTDVIEGAGGLHKFMNRREGPLITDSGGFQVFSLAYGSVHEELSSGGELKKNSSNKKNNNSKSGKNSGPPVKVTEDGVKFKSYRDGRQILLTPESTVQAQKALGADIIIPLDELPPYHTDRERLVESVELTHRWEARSLREHLKDVRQQAMYCVIHGGTDVELRTKSIEYLTSLPFDGYAIGGSLGKDGSELAELLGWMMPLLDQEGRRDKPRHLLGIADDRNIPNGIANGIDTFDSCYPTRLARHGTFLTRREGHLHIASGAKHSRSYGVPIDPECACPTCQHYDRPYLWHLYKAKEPLFVPLAAVHNVQYMNDMMEQYRKDILDGKI